ncbi:MAG TPA: Holliday junction branch migration protein RuvA [Aliidongia sp.]|nr:Holliday junction branch migration protein RuvA [Aliidongia sp.]
MMLARLRGTVEDIGLDALVIDVGGLGYPVLVSNRTRAALPAMGQPATLLIETQIREDNVTYFGFIDRAERDWFRLLTTVQGVGGKVALNILSALDPDRLAQAIRAEDRAQLSRADGVGPKLAVRLVTELKGKAAGWATDPIMLSTAAAAAAAGPAEEAVSALVNLGYKRPDALGAVATAARKLGDGATTGALITAGLKEMAP